jgi:hypothetical protein
MNTPIIDLVRSALASSAAEDVYTELENRAEEVIWHLNGPEAEEMLRADFESAGNDQIIRFYEALAAGDAHELGEVERPSGEDLARVEAFLQAADEKAGAVGRAFELLLELLPEHVRDFETYLGQLPMAPVEVQEALREEPDVIAAGQASDVLVSRGFSPATVLGATEAISRLVNRSFRYGDIAENAVVHLVSEDYHVSVSPSPLTEQMFVEEIEDTCRCSKDTARALLRWAVEASEHHPNLFRRLETKATPFAQGGRGVDLKRGTEKFETLTKQWTAVPVTR